MSAQNHVPCLACQMGSLLAVYEPYPVRISELQTVMSDPARFMKCDSCGDVIMHGDETKRADLSAGKNLLSQVIQQEQTLNGQAVAFLRALVSITAKELSLRLRLDATTVSQWEGRNTTLPQPTAFAVSVFFLREMAKDRHEFLKEIEELILRAFSRVA
jgi:DNA-binding transcriptional regulator YiaG